MKLKFIILKGLRAALICAFATTCLARPSLASADSPDTSGEESHQVHQFCETSPTKDGNPITPICSQSCTNTLFTYAGISVASKKLVSNGMVMYACASSTHAKDKCCKVFTICGYNKYYGLSGCDLYTGLNPAETGSRCYKTVKSNKPCPVAKYGDDWK